jgi:hypothetical protein
MLNRSRLIIAFGIILLMAVIFAAGVLWNEPWLSSKHVAIHLVIDNRSDKQIGPFVISEDQDSEPLHIKQIEPFSVVDVYYTKSESWGENAITMTDNNGKNYSVVPYFENQQRGRVDIRVECVTADGLSGKKRDLVYRYFSFEWYSWGASTCE